MSRTLDYTVINAQHVACAVPIEIDGEPAVANTTRAVIEAEPVDRAGKTLTLVLPASALEDFGENDRISITINTAADLAAQQPET